MLVGVQPITRLVFDSNMVTRWSSALTNPLSPKTVCVCVCNDYTPTCDLNIKTTHFHQLHRLFEVLSVRMCVFRYVHICQHMLCVQYVHALLACVCVYMPGTACTPFPVTLTKPPNSFLVESKKKKKYWNKIYLLNFIFLSNIILVVLLHILIDGS